MTTTIYGASDDLIEFEGDITEEFNIYPEDDETWHLAFSNGVLLAGRYDRDGIWRFERLAGEATVTKCEERDADAYSDLVTVEEAEWVAFCTQIARRNRKATQ